ncbi:hypothetical protein [Sphaerisporangium corydalis]|uniref:ATPase AAA-type core domain-containing protein n=1 Tax=Sphaerisporangium corydalis TaxID=1441875 RepID=A0ABV9ET03_9ACTN
MLFLDEPATGLDPRNRGEAWEMMRALVADGTTVLLTTEYLDEADQLAGTITGNDQDRVPGSLPPFFPQPADPSTCLPSRSADSP